MKKLFRWALSFAVVFTLSWTFSIGAQEVTGTNPTDSTSESTETSSESTNNDTGSTVEDNSSSTPASDDSTTNESTNTSSSTTEENDVEKFVKMTPAEQCQFMEDNDLWKTDLGQSYLSALSEAQKRALSHYLDSIPISVPLTIPFTEAGPILKSKPSKRRLKRAATAAVAATNPDGLNLNKTATKVEGTNQYKIALEIATTGTVETVTTQQANDIVLVLDQSGSMTDGFGGTTKQAALKEAVNNFIDAVAAKYNSQANHRIGIVTYNTTSYQRYALTEVNSTGATRLKNSVNSLSTPSGSTRIDLGIQRAGSMLINAPSISGSADRNKVVIVFTDGFPTANNGFEIDVADNAIENARTLKYNFGATVYSVGIFNGANVEQYYGKFPQFNPTRETGEKGGYWEERKQSNKNYQDPDIPAANRFMNYLSSNHTNASSLDLSVSYHGWGDYKRYTLTEDTLERNNTGYYLSAANAGDLDKIFKSIASKIETPTIQLNSTTHIHDIVAPQFTLPSGWWDVQVYTQEYLGNGQYSSQKIRKWDVDISVDPNTNSVDVTGFDFNQNFISEQDKGNGDHGRKLVIEFLITERSGFLGGDNVTTNMPGSGVYYNGNQIGSFPIPHVDIPVGDLTVSTSDLNVYYGKDVTDLDVLKKAKVKIGRTSLDLTKENYGLEYWQVQYITVKPQIFTKEGNQTSFDDASGGIVNIQDDLRYYVTVSVTSGGEEKRKETNEWSINVYKPELTFEDGTIALGATLADDYSSNVTEVVWKRGSDTLSDGSSDNGDAPALTYTFKAVSGVDSDNVVTTSTNVPMKLTKLRLDDRYDADLSKVTLNSTDLGAAGSGNFALVVESGSLTITKTGGSEDETYRFVITNESGVSRTVLIKGNGSKLIKGLANGAYTVHEDADWSWHYTVADQTVNISDDVRQASVTMNNKRKKTPGWLNDYTVVLKNTAERRAS